MRCPNCHSHNLKKVNKGLAIFGFAALGIIGLITIIAPIIAIVFIAKTLKGPDYYTCQDCKKKFSETEAKAVALHS